MKNLITSVSLFIIPFLASAQIFEGGSRTFGDIVTNLIGDLSSYFITFITGLSAFIFIWGIVKYIWKGDNETERRKGRQFMMWGLIGLFVMFSVVGIVMILGETFFPGRVGGIPQF